MDPLKNEAKPMSIANELPSFTHAIQPLLVFEALFHPTSDLLYPAMVIIRHLTMHEPLIDDLRNRITQDVANCCRVP